MSAAVLQSLAVDVVRMAIEAGATAAECTASQGDEFSVSVRQGEIDKLKDAGSRAAGVRVLIGQRAGSSYTSDLSGEGLRYMIDSAMATARIATEDPYAGMPEAGDLGSLGGDLKLYADDVEQLDTGVKIDQALRAEKAAFAVDPRIANSEGATFDSGTSYRAFANSLGFEGSYRSSSYSLSAVPVAKAGDVMERDYWYTLARSAAGLESPEDVGRKAAERALRRLGRRKVATQRVPVIFEQRVARSLLEHIFEAVSGDSVYRQTSFLAGKLGQRIASEHLTVIDDGTIPGLFGTSPFDDEGVPTRRTTVIDRGVLSSYLLNTYTARKLGLRTTGNASRGIAGNAHVGHGNLYVEKGERTPDDLIGSLGTGFYVTELMGYGVNIVTGDYSRGASGLWIENGRLSYPVSEVTVAGTLQEILMSIDGVASDLEFRGSTAAPALLIREMTVSGQ
jgi:PmbA protein